MLSNYNPQIRIKLKDGKLQYKLQGTIGGDQIDYPGNVATYTAILKTIRVLLNVTVSEDAFIMTSLDMHCSGNECWWFPFSIS